MFFVSIGLFVSFCLSQECLTKPTDLSFEDITSGGSFSESNIYSCNIKFKSPISVVKGLLYISHCNFTNLKNGPAISVAPDGLANDKSIEINQCNFLYCANKAISISSTSSSRLFNIDGCSFTFCSSQTNDGIAVDFKARYGIIQKCHFMNNVWGQNKFDIYYDSTSSEESTNKLTVKNCVFERKSKSGYTLYYFFAFKRGSKFDFVNNDVSIHPDAISVGKIIQWPDGENKEGITISENTMYPYEEQYIVNIKDNFPDGFSIRPEMVCPSPPQDPSIDPKNFLCENYFGDYTAESKEGPAFSSYSLVGLYNTEFHYIVNEKTNKGGAVYIFANNIPSTITNPIIIHNCDFTACRAKEGSAVYLESTEASRLFDIYGCHFYLNNDYYNAQNEYSGGSIFIKSKGASFKIIKCLFKDSTSGTGGAIYYTINDPELSSKKLLETSEEYPFALFIADCTFVGNQVDGDGGAIYISTNAQALKPIEINNCLFIQNNANNDDDWQPDVYDIPERGGAIYYRLKYLQSSSPASVLDTTSQENTFRVINCIFDQNSVSHSGGAIYLLIEEELSKPIEITGCLFIDNKADIGKDGATIIYGSGASIMYDFNSKSLPTVRDSPSLYIYDCEFTNSLSIVEGGAIAISIQSGIPSGPIEIIQCNFAGNKAKYNVDDQSYNHESTGIGGDILYIYNSSTTSSNDPNSNPHLNINNCSFSNSLGFISGGSIYLLIQNELAKTIELNNCTFNKCESGTKEAIFIDSNSLSTQIRIIECEFQQYAIAFHAPSGNIENCKFTDVTSFALDYNYEVDEFITNAKLVITECIFNQDVQIDSLIYFSTKIASKFEFTNNSISIPNGKAYAFGSKVLYDNIVKDQWLFDPPNLIDPPNQTYIKTENAKDIPANCFDGFVCEEPKLKCPNNTRCEIDGNVDPDLIVNITEYLYDAAELSGEHDGSAINLINFALFCKNTQFNGLKAVNHGGGAIYIKIDKEIPESIYLEENTFTKCEAVYGGAIYIYSEKKEYEITILNCIFEDNKANLEPNANLDNYLFGGSACFLQALNATLIRCKYRRNVGTSIKIYNDYSKLPLSLLSIKSDEDISSSISISECSFEADKKSESSIYYVRGSKFEIPVKVNNCAFTGELSKKAHHIDGKTLGKNNELPKILIESCEFSSDKKSALNLENLEMKLDSDNKFAQKLNSFEKKVNKSNLPSVLTLCTICTLTILAIVLVTLKKIKSRDYSESIEEQNEL